MFDWTYDDGDNFRSAIGEEFYAVGKIEEGKNWFEEWLKKEPHNESALCAYSWRIQENEGAEKAYQLIRGEVVENVCSIHNYVLFERAKFLAQHLKLEKDLGRIEEQLRTFKESMEKADYYNDLYDDFHLPVQQPIVKIRRFIRMTHAHAVVAKNIRNVVEDNRGKRSCFVCSMKMLAD